MLKGNEYIFRVMAENKYGLGVPLESRPVLAKDPFTVPSAPGQPEVSSSIPCNVNSTPGNDCIGWEAFFLCFYVFYNRSLQLEKSLLSLHGHVQNVMAAMIYQDTISKEKREILYVGLEPLGGKN